MLNYLKLLIIFIIFSSHFFLFAKERTLKIYYYERPPYYFTNDQGLPDGILNNLVKKILDKAKIKYCFESIPIKRIFLLLEKDDYACSPGWFKTLERLKKFKYTLPIYKSKRGVALFYKKIKIQNNISLAVLFKKKYKLALISGFNYGPIIEKYLNKYHPMFIKVTTTPDNLMKMVAVNRVDYTFFSLENIEKFFKEYPNYAKNLKIVNVLEITEGIKRHIICSKRVDDETINRINKAILQLGILK